MHTIEYEILHSEQFKKNLSGNQIESLLNYFIFKALSPILQTLWFKNELALILNYISKHAKHKFTNKEKVRIVSYLIDTIQVIDHSKIIELLKQSELDREFLIDILDKFCYLFDKLLKLDADFYQKLNNNNYDLKASRELNEFLESFNNLPLTFLLLSGKEVKYWYDKYIEFRDLVISKYYRLAFKFAKMTKYAKPNTDIYCLFKSLLISINTALNKYTAKKGTLTSYIQLWFKATMVNPKYDFELGRPFKLSNYGKQKMIDNGYNPNAISTDDQEFKSLENKASNEYLDNNLDALEITNLDLLNFLNSVNCLDVDITRLILNIPRIKK